MGKVSGLTLSAMVSPMVPRTGVPHLLQNWKLVSYHPFTPAESWQLREKNLVGDPKRPKLVFAQDSIVLDDGERLLGRVQPHVALLGADAAVAHHCALDFGHLNFKDVGTAVAIATVGLGCFL